MPIIKANNLNIYYELHGHGEPLVLIAGLSKDSSGWFQQVDVFSQHFQVLLFDNRGVGRTEAPDVPYTTQMMAEDVIALMNELHIPSAHVLGHSLGGCIAQQIAIHYPQKVKRLVLLDTFAEPLLLTRYILDLAAELQNKNIAIELRAKVQLPWSFCANFLAKPENIALILSTIANNPYPQKPHAFLHQITACKNHNTKNLLSQITAHTLVMEGAEDILTPTVCAQELLQNIPHAQHAVIPHAGHNGPLENPTFFNDQVLNFLIATT